LRTVLPARFEAHAEIQSLHGAVFDLLFHVGRQNVRGGAREGQQLGHSGQLMDQRSRIGRSGTGGLVQTSVFLDIQGAEPFRRGVLC